jgi:type II secretory pathway pseudopilin PulG
MRKSFQKSFTMLEILIYIGVFLIVTTAILALVLWLVNANTKSKAMREVLTNARKSMELITREIKSAKTVYIPTTNSTQISLETLNYLPDGEDASYVDIYQCGPSICFKKESQNPEIITSASVNVTNLSFTQILTGSVSSFQVNLTVNYNNPSNRPEYQAQVSLTSTASLRGY